MKTSVCLVGCATGFSGDRTDGAQALVQAMKARGGGTLVFETLAERTLALAQLARNHNPDGGYEPLLDELLLPVLKDCLQHNIRIVSNFGAANPPAAAKRIAALASELGLPCPRIAIVYGDCIDQPEQYMALRQRLGAALDDVEVVSANAYIGALEIAEALAVGAQIVVAGRVSDPSLTLGPAIAHYGWHPEDWERLGRATIAGHLLECGLQVTGGYFAIPQLKPVPDLYRAGYPLAEIYEDGSFVITKPDDTGGLVDIQTIKEQLLYEVHDPACYLTPDVIADLSAAYVEEVGKDRVAVHGITGHARPHELKVNVFHRGGWLAEAEISYAGLQAEARARMAADIVRARLGGELKLRIDLIGAQSILAGDESNSIEALSDAAHRDIRLRIATSHKNSKQAERVLREVNALYTCGPAGGGGVRTSLRSRLHMLSCTIPRTMINTGWRWFKEVS